jgi:glutamate synthase (NADPH/NADH) small chain
VGTSNRHKAKSITQIELLTKPPTQRTENNPWPEWPMVVRTSSSHEEGAQREWALLTKEFIGDENGNVTGLKLVNIEWEVPEPGKRPGFKEIEGTERIIPCDLALLAIGFVHPEHGYLEELNVTLDNRGNVQAEDYQTNQDKIFTAGDMRRGQSLVVWAIAEGREAAKRVDTFLMGYSELESRDDSFLNVSQMQ